MRRADRLFQIIQVLRRTRKPLTADAIAADLTNNLVPGVVLVPSVVAYLAELQDARFTYAKGA